MEQGRAEAQSPARARVPAQAGSAVPHGDFVVHERATAVRAATAATPDAARRPQRHSVRGQVLAALREALLAGELAPGEVYSAPALAARYGVSATPVREAMQQLAGEDAVEVVPNRGFRVAERSARDLAELAEVRAMLEIPAVVRLARVLRPERWEELRPQAADCVTAAAHGDRVGYAEADRAFHHALMSLTGNRRLVEVTDDLLRRTQRPAGGSRLRRAELLADASEHSALLDALAAQEYDVAERVARAHLSAARHPH
ncbi:GntR family transcriptional regulator [Streptomyces pinistramenti]|uniref:GntR family transcriptional regulator n=1 Tax=Streptomyces pinistramenti TaxID=2884812 RepID=UPI001D084307|nr:GntR family transcriptional regulator [Streptomyces pinistramenti]MCB5908194.1 GntR family transcriptional regulator [Streptomyces pinistramenti]